MKRRAEGGNNKFPVWELFVLLRIQTTEKRKKDLKKGVEMSGRFQRPLTWYLQGVDYWLQSAIPRPPFPTPKILYVTCSVLLPLDHGLDTRVLL